MARCWPSTRHWWQTCPEIGVLGSWARIYVSVGMIWGGSCPPTPLEAVPTESSQPYDLTCCGGWQVCRRVAGGVVLFDLNLHEVPSIWAWSKTYYVRGEF